MPFLTPSLIILALSLPLILGVVPRNRFYGVRVPQTMADDATWYSTNRLGGIALCLASLGYLGVAFLWPQRNPADFSTWLLHLAAFAGPLVAALLLVVRHLRKS